MLFFKTEWGIIFVSLNTLLCVNVAAKTYDRMLKHGTNFHPKTFQQTDFAVLSCIPLSV